MKLNTKHFGEIDIDETRIIDFEEGLPGFPDDKQFILVDYEEPFFWLQSVTDGENSFILVDACAVVPDYNPEVEEDKVISLGPYNAEDFLIYNIVVLPEDIRDMTVNLLAPVVINSATKKGKQVIVQNDKYSIRHYMLGPREG